MLVCLYMLREATCARCRHWLSETGEKLVPPYYRDPSVVGMMAEADSEIDAESQTPALTATPTLTETVTQYDRRSQSGGGDTGTDTDADETAQQIAATPVDDEGVRGS